MSGSKKSKSKASKTTKTTTPSKTVETTAVETTTETTETVNPTTQEFDSVLTDLTTLTAQLKTLTTRVRTLQKQHAKTVRMAERKSKGKKTGGSKTISGFATPTKISNELCSFMGVQSGTEVARTEVTKYLSKYIKENSLQDTQNRRVIVPDKKLGKLLGVTKSDSVTYFNLQKYMKPHFTSSKSA